MPCCILCCLPASQAVLKRFRRVSAILVSHCFLLAVGHQASRPPALQLTLQTRGTYRLELKDSPEFSKLIDLFRGYCMYNITIWLSLFFLFCQATSSCTWKITHRVCNPIIILWSTSSNSHDTVLTCCWSGHQWTFRVCLFPKCVHGWHTSGGKNPNQWILHAFKETRSNRLT